MFASLLFDSWIGSLKNPPLFLTGVSLITSGHFYLGETGHYYSGLTIFFSGSLDLPQRNSRECAGFLMP